MLPYQNAVPEQLLISTFLGGTALDVDREERKLLTGSNTSVTTTTHIHNTIHPGEPQDSVRKLLANIPHMSFDKKCVAWARKEWKWQPKLILGATPLNRKHLPRFLQVICVASSHEAQAEVNFGGIIFNSRRFSF